MRLRGRHTCRLQLQRLAGGGSSTCGRHQGQDVQLKRALKIAILTLLLVYLGDGLSVRYRIPRSRDPLATVQVRRYYAVPRKDGKTELIFDQPETQTCVRSIFPHLGYNPCWYVRRKTQRRVDM